MTKSGEKIQTAIGIYVVDGILGSADPLAYKDTDHYDTHPFTRCHLLTL